MNQEKLEKVWTKEEIEEKVAEIIRRELDFRKLDITPEVKFIDDLGADSLDLITLAWALEYEFGLKIDDAESETLDTVGKVIDFIAWKLGLEPERPIFLSQGITITGYLGSHRPV